MSNIPELSKFSYIFNTKLFIQSPIIFFDQFFKEKGDSFRFSLLTRKLIGTRDPKWMDHILVKQQKKYNKDFSMKQIGVALGKGLLTNSGESWMKQRRLAQPAFYKKRIESMVDVMENITDDYIEKLKKLPAGTRFKIDEDMMALTASIALQTLLGEKFSDDLRLVQSSMANIQEFLIKRIRIPFFTFTSQFDGSEKEFKKKLKVIDDIVYKIIENKKNDPGDGNNLVSMLLDAKDEITGEGMPDQQLRDELLTIYVAGHETSAYCLSWTFYELIRHPQVYQKIRDEVSAVAKDGHIGPEGLKKLNYTRAVVMESMRMHPPAYLLSRECGEDDEIDGNQIKKGEVLLVSVYHIHRHPALWKNPNVFHPERMLENSEAVRNYYLPFGAGPRMCIGNHFALMEITLILAKIVCNIDLEWVTGQKIEYQPMITLKPKHGIMLEKI